MSTRLPRNQYPSVPLLPKRLRIAHSIPATLFPVSGPYSGFRRFQVSSPWCLSTRRSTLKDFPVNTMARTAWRLRDVSCAVAPSGHRQSACQLHILRHNIPPSAQVWSRPS
eukprot:157289-Amphidinium_carterae.2